MEYFITAVPRASWETLAGQLYYMQQHEALEKVKVYIQQQPGMGEQDSGVSWNVAERKYHQLIITLAVVLGMFGETDNSVYTVEIT